MKKYLLLVVFIMSSMVTFSQEDVTTYYLIRHAEKNKTDKTNKDPHLTFKGTKRADNWAKVFKNVKFDAIYTTNYNRTKETGQPTATQQGLKMYLYNPRDMYNEGFKYTTKGKNVLVVGHSNTTPAFVNKILGVKKYTDIEDDNNNNLYIVTVTKEGATAVLLNVEFSN